MDVATDIISLKKVIVRIVISGSLYLFYGLIATKDTHRDYRCRKKENIMKTAFTHYGKFHADDVFSAALLTIMNPEITISRGFKVPDGFDGTVFDIGLGEFDHHQVDNEVRENGIPYASFGKLWRAFGPQLTSQRVVDKVDEILVQPIDATDNGMDRNMLSSAIGGFNPTWDSEESPDACFFMAVEFAKSILFNTLKQEESKVKAEELLSAGIKDSVGRLVILPRYVPFSEAYIKEPVDFVVFPSNRGGYNLQAVPSGEGMSSKVLLPESWLTDQVAGMTFVHKGRFIASFDTLDSAVSAAVSFI